MMNLENRVAIVTGGTRGIGRAIAEKLTALQCQVVITGRSEGADVVAAIEKLGGKCAFIRTDISNEEAVEKLFAEVAERFGGCDILVNNAGIAKDFLLMRSKVADWREVIDTNLIGALLCSRAAVKQMLKRKAGRIINISSVVGITGNAGQSVYAGTKAALIGVTKSLAKEVGSRNITVNAVAPGFIATEMTDKLPDNVKQEYYKSIPLGRFGTPEDVAQCVAFLASDAAAYVTGEVLSVNGGMA